MTHKQSGRCRTAGSVTRATRSRDDELIAICDFWTMQLMTDCSIMGRWNENPMIA